VAALSEGNGETTPARVVSIVILYSVSGTLWRWAVFIPIDDGPPP
jgi:hypothetical protein